MSNYTKTTDFGAKDSLPTGDSGKIIRGTEFETEFDAISTAIATKADIAGPTFTGTLTYETISDGTISITAFVDEDDMSSNSANLVPTQQSVKAYVDSQVTAQDLDFQADSGGALSIDLDTETMTFTGGTGIDTSGSGNAVTFAIDSTVATLTGTQTLTNKTLTSPDVNTPDIDGGTIDGTVIGGTTAAAGSFTTVSATGNITVDGTVDGRDVATDGTKLDGIESGATADQTAAEIRTLVDSATDSNVFTDADHTKLDGIEANATADQTDAEIRAAVEAATDSNVFTDADHTKLDGIEAGADVTDTTNVTAAGAVMDSELTNETAVKSLNQGVATTDSPTFAGLTTTANVSFGDNDKAIFGAGSDLQIYHDGSNSYISDQGTGNLRILGDEVLIANAANNEFKAVFNSDGAASLYYDSSVKIATTSTGIDVTGTVTADSLTVDSSGSINSGSSTGTLTLYGGSTNQGGKIVLDGGNNDGDIVFHAQQYTATPLQRMLIAANGDVSLYEDTGTTAKFHWDSSAESLGIGTSSPAFGLSVESDNGSGYAALFRKSSSDPALTIQTTSSITQIQGLNSALSATNDIAMQLSGGNVGIGISSPTSGYNNTSALDVSGPVLARGAVSAHQTNAGVFQYNANETAIRSYGATSGSGLITFSTGGGGAADTERMRIDSSGNVGIGLTPENSSGTWRNFEQGGMNLAGRSAGGVDGMIGTNYVFKTDNSEVYKYTAGTSRLFFDANEIRFQQAASGTAGTAISWSEAMRIDSSGNLLVGTTDTFVADNTSGNGLSYRASAGDLGVAATNTPAFYANRMSSDGAIADFRKDGSTVGSIQARGGDLVIGTDDTGIRFNDANNALQPHHATDVTDATIDIGLSSQRFKDLYLSGGVIAGSAVSNYKNTFSFDGTSINGIAVNNTSGSGTPAHIAFFQNGTGVGSITCTASATAYNTSSDYRLKENVVEMSGATERLKQLAPKRFNFIADADTTVDGFLAHEVQSVVPEAITGTHNEVDDDGNPVYQGIDQSKLVPLLVATIQELEARIAALESN